MSMNPNDPFESNQNDQGDAQSPPPKKSNKGCLIGCGVVSVLTLFVCCGGGFFIAWFISSVTSEELERRLTGNPVIEEHIGEIQSIQLEWIATSQKAQEAGEEGKPGKLVFSIQGSKGSGTVLVEQESEGGQINLDSAVLELPDGSQHSLELTVMPEGMEEFDVEGLEMDLGELIDTGEIDADVPDFDSGAVQSEPPESSVPEADTPQEVTETVE